MHNLFAASVSKMLIFFDSFLLWYLCKANNNFLYKIPDRKILQNYCLNYDFYHLYFFGSYVVVKSQKISFVQLRISYEQTNFLAQQTIEFLNVIPRFLVSSSFLNTSAPAKQSVMKWEHYRNHKCDCILRQITYRWNSRENASFYVSIALMKEFISKWKV